MPTSLRNPIPLTFVARGLSDAVDGTTVPRGAMRVLTNLIPNPRNAGQFICRPAAELIVDFAAAFDTPTQITAVIKQAVGNILYGMVSTSRFPGKDEPFALDLQTGAFLAVSGVTSTNVPNSPAPTGDWTPPIVKHVGSRVIVTHPGFSDAVKFGWFDNSGFSLTTTGNVDEHRSFVGDTDLSDADYIHGIPPGTLPGPADVGFTVTGAGIQAGTTITEVDQVGILFSANTNSTANISNITINGSLDTTGLYVGQVVQGADIPDGTQIQSINRAAHTAVLTNSATATTASDPLGAIGSKVKLSLPVTATADAVAFTFFDEKVITGNPVTTGVQPGQLVTGGGLPANDEVVSVAATQIQLSGMTTVGSNLIQVLIWPGGISKGMAVTAAGVPPGTTVLGTLASTVPVLTKYIIVSNPATSAGWSTVTLTGSQITLSIGSSTPALNASLTIAGGTETAPLWGAGDTAPNNLPSQPVGVGEMNGRAWYALGTDGIVYSDALLPCSVTNATQALVPGNGLPVTAIGELKLTSTQLGGTVQGLLAFQADADIQQITGDATTLNLVMADLSCATGTHAPLTITPTTKGTFFVSPEGLRLAGFSGQVSDPIGQDGNGVVGPFLDVTNPPLTGDAPASRMCAAANGRTVRITVPTGTGTFAEYWYDLIRNAWTGPHTSTAMQIANWTSTFVLAPTQAAEMVRIYRSDDVQDPGDSYVEYGQALTWAWEPSLMPDSGQMAENVIIESALMVALQPTELIRVMFLNEVGAPLDGVTVNGYVIPTVNWGSGYFDQTLVGPDNGAIRQRLLPWSKPLVFKQGTVNLRGLSSSTIIIGNLYLRYQITGYVLEVLQVPPEPTDDEIFFVANDGVTIIRDNTGNINIRPR